MRSNCKSCKMGTSIMEHLLWNIMEHRLVTRLTLLDNLSRNPIDFNVCNIDEESSVAKIVTVQEDRGQSYKVHTESLHLR